MSELTERVSIEAEAVDLGWALHRIAPDATAFGHTGRLLTVVWSEAGAATRGQLTCEGGTVIIATRELTGDGTTLGPWVRDTLRIWRLKFASEVGA